jgi:hypothetical protein
MKAMTIMMMMTTPMILLGQVEGIRSLQWPSPRTAGTG